MGGYGARVAVYGTHYVYRVLRPERCTLSLARTRDGWRIHELEGRASRPVSTATRRFVELWIDGKAVEAWAEPEEVTLPGD